MYILGISCFYHDAAAALIKDGKIIAASEEERFSRKKHDSNFPVQSIEFCLKYAGISITKIDFIVFYEKPFVKFERILFQIFGTVPFSSTLFRKTIKEWVLKKLWIKQTIAEKLQIPPKKILFSDHHMSHAAASFYPSPFTQAAILTLDGVGEWSCASYGIGRNNLIHLTHEMRFPHSLGLLYSTFTAFLGFEVNEGEYKVMGMAPYGKPNYVKEIKKLVDIKPDGSFQLDLSYFSFHNSPYSSFNNTFTELFGPPRKPHSVFFVQKNKSASQSQLVQNRYFADIAASIQAVTEEIIITMCNHLANETKQTNLCFSGGVALNSMANWKIITRTPFKNVFIQPAAGDDGGALGAALYVYHHVLGNKKRTPLPDAFLGEKYTEKEIENSLKKADLKYKKYSDSALLSKIAKALIDQKVIGWFEGRCEWGPRALGHRSILADPRNKKMKQIVNEKIKFREPFRPFAPAVLKERADDFLEIPKDKSELLKYMLLVVPVKKDKQKMIPAVSHHGTTRVQIVNKKNNLRFHKLIMNFAQITKVPILLNTSFNIRGEPIVASPDDAIATFLKSGIDILVLENYVVYK